AVQPTGAQCPFSGECPRRPPATVNIPKQAKPDRSVVTAPDEPVVLRILERSGPAAISIDGQLRGVLDPGDWIGVYAAPHRLRAVRLGPMDFYGRLRERMNLTDAPAAVADGTPAPLWSLNTPAPEDLAHLALPEAPDGLSSIQ
ncbi:hypothetical protein ACWCOW_42860, partial [Streptomyces sp. NPDC001939]